MTEREYQKAMECFTPGPGLRARVQTATERTEKPRARVRPLRTVLIAAAVCLALAGTAFAASPGLRDLLAEALGGFAPYAQEQDGTAYTWNGFEFKVLSALADENMLRVYVQIRDLEQRDRVNLYGESWLKEGPDLGIGNLKSSVETTGGNSSTSFDHYDGETQTTMAVMTVWGRMTEDLSGAELRIDTAQNMMDAPSKAAVKIPLDIELLHSRTLLRFEDTVLDGARAEELRISPLSVTLITGRESWAQWPRFDISFRVQLKDGSQVGTERESASGHGTYKTSDGAHHLAQIWNFADPVEVDQVAGVYIGEEYFPVK